jgi:hypothetical protein
MWCGCGQRAKSQSIQNVVVFPQESPGHEFEFHPSSFAQFTEWSYPQNDAKAGVTDQVRPAIPAPAVATEIRPTREMKDRRDMLDARYVVTRVKGPP